MNLKVTNFSNDHNKCIMFYIKNAPEDISKSDIVEKFSKYINVVGDVYEINYDVEIPSLSNSVINWKGLE